MKTAFDSMQTEKHLLERRIESLWDNVFVWMSVNNYYEVNKCKQMIDELEKEFAVCIKSEGFKKWFLYSGILVGKGTHRMAQIPCYAKCQFHHHLNKSALAFCITLSGFKKWRIKHKKYEEVQQ